MQQEHQPEVESRPKKSNEVTAAKTNTDGKATPIASLKKFIASIFHAHFPDSSDQVNPEIEKLKADTLQKLAVFKKHLDTIKDRSSYTYIDTPLQTHYDRFSRIYDYLKQHFLADSKPWEDFTNILNSYILDVNTYIRNMSDTKDIALLANSSYLLQLIHTDSKDQPDKFKKLLHIFRQHGADIGEAVFYCRSVKVPKVVLSDVSEKYPNDPAINKFEFIANGFLALIDKHPQLKGKLAMIIRLLSQSGVAVNTYEKYEKIMWHLYEHPEDLDLTEIQTMLK